MLFILVVVNFFPLCKAGKILAAVMNYGELNGVRVLKASTVKAMLSAARLSPPGSGLLDNHAFTQGGLAVFNNTLLRKYGCRTSPALLATEEEKIYGWW